MLDKIGPGSGTDNRGVRGASCSPRAGAACRLACALALVLAVVTGCGSEAAHRRDVRNAEVAARANLDTIRSGLAHALTYETSPGAVVDHVRWLLEPKQDPWTAFLLDDATSGDVVRLRVAVLGASRANPFGWRESAYAEVCADLSGTWPGPAIVSVRQVGCPPGLPAAAPPVDSVLQPAR